MADQAREAGTAALSCGADAAAESGGIVAMRPGRLRSDDHGEVARLRDAACYQKSLPPRTVLPCSTRASRPRHIWMYSHRPEKAKNSSARPDMIETIMPSGSEAARPSGDGAAGRRSSRPACGLGRQVMVSGHVKPAASRPLLRPSPAPRSLPSRTRRGWPAPDLAEHAR